MNIGGPNETASTPLFAIVFLICLIRAYFFIRRKQVARHREWMIPAYGLGLGVATTRPIVGVFLGIALWLGFTTRFLASEAWVDYTRDRARARLGVSEDASETSLPA